MGMLARVLDINGCVDHVNTICGMGCSMMPDQDRASVCRQRIDCGLNGWSAVRYSIRRRINGTHRCASLTNRQLPVWNDRRAGRRKVVWIVVQLLCRNWE